MHVTVMRFNPYLTHASSCVSVLMPAVACGSSRNQQAVMLVAVPAGPTQLEPSS